MGSVEEARAASLQSPRARRRLCPIRLSLRKIFLSAFTLGRAARSSIFRAFSSARPSCASWRFCEFPFHRTHPGSTWGGGSGARNDPRGRRNRRRAGSKQTAHHNRYVCKREPWLGQTAVQKRYKLKSVALAVEKSDGGASRDRTDDIIVANDALSQLSYSPTCRKGCSDFTSLGAAYKIQRLAFAGLVRPGTRAATIRASKPGANRFM